MSWEMAGRAATYLASLGVFGALFLPWLIARAEGRTATAAEMSQLRRLGLVFASALLVATLGRALCQSAMVWGASDALGWENLRAVALESRWGGRWRWQPVTVGLVVIGFYAARWLPRAGRALALAGALAFAAVLPMTGHAYGHPVLWIAQSVHVVAFGSWLGTLSVALLARRPGAERERWLVSFAPFAVAGVAGVVSSGLVLSWAAFPSWSSLVESGYGRSYLAKLLLVAGILLLGALNHRALRTKAEAQSARLGLTIPGEVLLSVLVLLLTSVLTSLPQPDAGH